MPNIISYQGQECLVVKTVIMTKDMLVSNLFKKLFDSNSTLKSPIYKNLLDKLQSNLVYQSCQTKYAQNKEVVIDAVGHYKNNRYVYAMSHLKKLGVIFPHKGFIYLNPLVETKTTSRFYELVIEYYDLLWCEEFKLNFSFSYKGTTYTFPSVEELRSIIVEEYKMLLQNDSKYNHYSTEDLYNIAFASKKVDLTNNEIILKSKMAQIYKNLGYTIMKEIAAEHFNILTEQLPMEVEPNSNKVNFGRLPSNFKPIHFSKTNAYQEGCSLSKLDNIINNNIATPDLEETLPTQDNKVPVSIIKETPKQKPMYINEEVIKVQEEFKQYEADLKAKGQVPSPEDIEEQSKKIEIAQATSSPYYSNK